MPSVEQQIEQSKAKKKALIKKSALGFALVVFIGASGVALVSYMSTVTPSADSANESVEALNANLVSSPANKPSSAFSEEERKAIQVSLIETKKKVNASAQRMAPSQTFSAKVGEIEMALNDAFNAYGASNYDAAERTLDNINRAVEKTNTAYENAYTEPYQKALNAFNNNDISSAFNYNKTTLKINPNFDEAIVLQQRIDVFNDVQDAYEQARVGKVENNIIKQRDAYASIVQLDPARTDAKQALDNINRKLQDGRFNTLLANANQAIEQGKFQAAKQYLNEARALKPSSDALNIINKRLSSLVASEEQKNVENQVTLFANADEWQTVQLVASKGLSTFPASPLLLEAKQNADAILTASKRLKAYQQWPERLSDSNVRSLAQQDINKARTHAGKSPKLLAQITALEQIVDHINKPRPVTITSDNDTYIKVLGVGLVGEVKSKTIQLKPGTYRIEGSRKGYRSTIQEIVVTPSATDLSVHIVCTEKV